MHIIPEIFIPAVIVLGVFILTFFKYPRWAIAGMVIAKPIIDLTWNYQIIYDINLLKIYAFVFALIGVIYIIRYRLNVLASPLSWLWLVFLCLNFVSIFLVTDTTLFVDKIDYFFRILNGFVVLVLFIHLFNYDINRRYILLVFIIAGVTPFLLYLIPLLTNTAIIAKYGFLRIIGPYHDFWNFMFYATQTIICCLAYLTITGKTKTYDTKSDRIQKSSALLAIFQRLLRFRLSITSVLLTIMIIISTFMVYTCYTKAGWITLVVVLLIWFVLRGKVIQTIVVFAIIAIVVFIDPFATDFQKPFENEIGYFLQDANEKEMVFRGRLSRWERGMDDFSTSPLVNKLLGQKKSDIDPENDYLRILWDNGIIGFAIYITLLCLTGYLLLRKFARRREPIVLAAILALIMYLLNSIGSYPMLYPAFQWFMWGIIGFVFAKRRTDSKE